MTAIKSLQRPRQSILGIGYELILSGADTQGQYELMRFLVPPGIGPPIHVHQHEDECFHLLSGQLRIVRGGETYSLVEGDSAHMPRKLPHAFRNESDAFADLLCWVSPATLESFFAAFLRPWPLDENVPPSPADSDIQAMLASAAEHDINIMLDHTAK